MTSKPTPLLRLLFSSITGLTVLVVSLAVPTARVHSAAASLAPALPGLKVFIRQVMNGDPEQLRGIYARDLFASVVLQQPAGYPSFISRDSGALTQFGNASDLGSTGLLAHNSLAGRYFSQLRAGQIIYLVYGDGHLQTFVVTQALRYRALQPKSEQSDFEDLSSGAHLGASGLFLSIYGRRGTLVFQTCIEADGNPNWGRLFIIAVPSGSGAQHRYLSAA